MTIEKETIDKLEKEGMIVIDRKSFQDVLNEPYLEIEKLRTKLDNAISLLIEFGFPEYNDMILRRKKIQEDINILEKKQK